MVFVEYLLLVFTYNYRTRYVHTHELLQHLNAYGYKLPCSVRDIYHFSNYYNQQIQPMLHRLGQCHKALELATGGELNVLGQPEYAGLRKLLARHP
jgi:hypothetical protein